MESQLPVVGMDHRAKESKAMQKEFYKVVWYYTILGGCPFHGRVERDEIPTRESPPKQSGTR